MKTPNGKYSCKNWYLQIVIHRGRASACGEKFTVMTACNTFGKRPCGWGAQKPCVIRAEARIDFTSLTRSVFTCSKRLLFEQPYYRKFTVTCGCNPRLPTAGQGHVGTAPLQVVPRGAEGLAPPQGARPWGGHPRLARDVHALGVDTERRPRCRAWSPHSGGDERAAGPACGSPPSGAMAAAPPCTPTGHRR